MSLTAFFGMFRATPESSAILGAMPTDTEPVPSQSDNISQMLENRQFDDLVRLKNTEGISIPGIEYRIDVATDTGDEEMVKFLTMNFNAKYSLYHKQMAMIGGHIGIVLWLEKFGQCRNNTTVFDVHRRMDRKTHKITYDNVIPVHMQSF
jgi:hypothetical protein